MVTHEICGVQEKGVLFSLSTLSSSHPGHRVGTAALGGIHRDGFLQQGVDGEPRVEHGVGPPGLGLVSD